MGVWRFDKQLSFKMQSEDDGLPHKLSHQKKVQTNMHLPTL